MTAEQKVKQKYPDARSIKSDEGPWFIVLRPDENKIAGIGVTPQAAWESALARVEATHE